MTKRIIDTSKTQPVIRDTSKTEPLIDPAVIAAALGAELVGTVEGGGSQLGMIARAAVHRDLFVRHCRADDDGLAAR